MPRKKKVEETVTNVAEDVVEAAKGAKEKVESVVRSVKAKVEADTVFSVQYQDKETTVDAIRSKVIEQFVSEGNVAEDIKNIKIYIKPEDLAAYYVVNDRFSGRVDLF